MPDTLASLQSALEDAVTLRHPDKPIDRTMRTAFGAAHNMWIALAYLAAHLRVDGGHWHVPASLAGSAGWQRYASDQWDEFARQLDRAPPGNEDIESDVLDQIVCDLANLLTRWLNTIGFDLRDTDEGMYFDVLNYDF